MTIKHDLEGLAEKVARPFPALKHHLTMLAEYVDHPMNPGDMGALADDLLKSAGVLAQHLYDGAGRERSWKGAAE